MPRDVRKYLFDILQACESLQQFAKEKTFSDYNADAFLRSAVERQFEIIGEALNQALREDSDLEAHISNAGQIIAFRNQLIHGYASVAHDTVWGILEGKLPILQKEVQNLLK